MRSMNIKRFSTLRITVIKQSNQWTQWNEIVVRVIMSPKMGTRTLCALLLVVAWCPGGSLTSQTPHDCQREVIHQTESIETQFRLHCNLRSVSRSRIIYLSVDLRNKWNVLLGVSQCPEKAPTRTFSLLKALTSYFTIKNLLRLV